MGNKEKGYSNYSISIRLDDQKISYLIVISHLLFDNLFLENNTNISLFFSDPSLFVFLFFPLFLFIYYLFIIYLLFIYFLIFIYFYFFCYLFIYFNYFIINKIKR